MKTPHAILIGLSLIAAAIFFKDTAANFTLIKDAHALVSKEKFYKCYFNRMEDVHIRLSGNVLKDHCWGR